MLPSITAIFLDLVNHIAILLVLIYIITQTGFITDIDHSRVKPKTKLFIVLLFGLFAIYATLDSIEILGAKANVRDLGPMIAGLIAGPWAGLGAGLIGGIHRYLLGGLTNLPCALATILAGLAAGIIFKINKGALLKSWTAALFAVAMESIHMLMVLGMAKPYSQALIVVKQIALPMILCNAIGLALFSSIAHSYKREKELKASQERIVADLKAAHDIQSSMLPRIFPPFPDREEFSLFATMEPAKEVGGDFFDFALISDNKLYFVIGDVSGKGIPAALFMVICKTLLKTEATQRPDITPAEIVYWVNNKLCPDNELMMFVSVFCGVLNITTGELQYANAGHNFPLISQEDGSFKYLEFTSGMALGVMPETPFKSGQLTLTRNQSLLLYTDGVTEAMNRDYQQFTPERLSEILKGAASMEVKEIVGHIQNAVANFVQDASQSDDLTLLALQYHGQS